MEKLASLYNIHLRTGCFCNTGACQKFLILSNEQVKNNLSAGHICGDDVDLIAGKPTGSVRISFGYMSTFTDAQTFLNFLEECFLERHINDTFCGTNTVADAKGCVLSMANTALICGTNTVADAKGCVLSMTNTALINHSGKSCDDMFEKNCSEDAKYRNLPEIPPKKASDSIVVDKTSISRGLEKTKLSSIAIVNQGHSSVMSNQVEDCHVDGNTNLRLEKICLYPIKSCAAFQVMMPNYMGVKTD